MSSSDERKKLEAQLTTDIAKRLAAFREKRFKTQADAVANFDYRIVSDNPEWNRYEKGRRGVPLVVLDYLHWEFGVDLNWLISGDEPVDKPLPPEIRGHISAIADYFTENW